MGSVPQKAEEYFVVIYQTSHSPGHHVNTEAKHSCPNPPCLVMTETMNATYARSEVFATAAAARKELAKHDKDNALLMRVTNKVI